MARSLAEQAVRDGVIEGNDDNCAVRYNKSGLWTTAVSWGDSRVCADIERVTSFIQESYPELPIVLLGLSYVSLLCS